MTSPQRTVALDRYEKLWEQNQIIIPGSGDIFKCPEGLSEEVLAEPHPVGKATGTRWTNRNEALERMVKGEVRGKKPFRAVSSAVVA